MLKSLLKNKTRGNRVEFWLKRKGKKTMVENSWMDNLIVRQNPAFIGSGQNPAFIGSGLGSALGGLGQWAGQPMTATNITNLMQKYVSSTATAF